MLHLNTKKLIFNDIHVVVNYSPPLLCCCRASARNRGSVHARRIRHLQPDALCTGCVQEIRSPSPSAANRAGCLSAVCLIGAHRRASMAHLTFPAAAITFLRAKINYGGQTQYQRKKGAMAVACRDGRGCKGAWICVTESPLIIMSGKLT